VTASIHRVAGRGLRNVLRHFGVLAGAVETRASLGLPETIVLRATDEDDYLFAPEAGHFETFVDLGDRVEPGQPIGRIHFLERPDREPEPIHAQTPGIVCVLRAVAVTQQGDNVVVVGRPAWREEIYQC
jgi:predicted deacylase